MNSPLSAALELTRTMLAAAQAGDWPRVGRLQARRSELLTPDVYTHADARERLPELDAAQRELTALIATAHADARRNLLNSQRASTAAHAYLDAARD